MRALQGIWGKVHHRAGLSCPLAQPLVEDCLAKWVKPSRLPVSREGWKAAGVSFQKHN